MCAKHIPPAAGQILVNLSGVGPGLGQDGTLLEPKIWPPFCGQHVGSFSGPEQAWANRWGTCFGSLFCLSFLGSISAPTLWLFPQKSLDLSTSMLIVVQAINSEPPVHYVVLTFLCRHALSCISFEECSRES